MNKRFTRWINHLSTWILEMCAGIKNSYIFLWSFSDEAIDNNMQFLQEMVPRTTSKVGEILYTHSQVKSQLSKSKQEKMVCQNKRKVTEITIDEAPEERRERVICREIMSVHIIRSRFEP